MKKNSKNFILCNKVAFLISIVSCLGLTIEITHVDIVINVITNNFNHNVKIFPEL